MLQRTAELVVDCHQRALEYAERARCAQTPDDREFYLDMERRWLYLARSYEFTDRLDALTRELDGRPRK